MRARRFYLFLAPLVVALAYGCGATSDGGKNGGDGGTGASGGNTNLPKDSDGDGISDVDEDAALGTDTDSDGTPDYLDTDSDDDGIPDSVEAGDSDLTTAPVDSDSDGTADFRDGDSDNNDILDEVEGEVDTDADGIGDYADGDNDGDGAGDVLEIVGEAMDCDGDLVADPTGSAESPADCDKDGIANYLDFDSDNDTISDLDEGATIDTDIDMMLDRYELDSDNDHFTDQHEAGDDDVNTPPVDTDKDGIPDFRDPDSDQDGLSDLKEWENGTNPQKEDSDDDGVSDLIEAAAGTNPNDPADNPQANGDFVFVVPYQDSTAPPDDTLEFRTSVQFADVYFLMDRTGSMNAEFAAMKATTGIPAIIAALRCKDTGNPCLIDTDCGANEICFSATNTCIDDPMTANAGAGCVPDMWTGFGTFYDCNTYQNFMPLQADPAKTAAAIPTGLMGGTESVLQSPACVSQPSLCTNNPQCSADPSVVNPIGCPGYRPEAVRLLIHITDAGNQGGTCGNKIPDVKMTGSALISNDIKYVGLYGTGDNGGTICNTAQSCLTQVGLASATVDKNNQPFVYPALDAQVVAATQKAVMDIVRGVPLYVTIGAADQEGDAGDALQFLDYLEVNVSGQGACTFVTPTADTDADSHDDAFPSLLGGTPVCWDVHPVDKQSTVPPTDDPQIFIAKLTVYGDNSPLDERDVYFLVPPKAATIPPPPN